MTAPFIELIDAKQYGILKAGAAYLVRGSRLALIESGTAVFAAEMDDTLGRLPIETIFLTHIHLDHAGGAGHLARLHPGAKIVVHERGCRHLADPSQLIAGVRNASPELFPLYGTPLPIPEHQLLPVSGGEVFDLGNGVLLEVIATPGHAPHHVCFLEQGTRTLFTGDAVGNWDNPVDVPLTVPPRFNLAKGLASLETLRRLQPEYLAFTHFGIANDALTHLDRYENELTVWFDRLRSLSKRQTPAQIENKIMGEAKYGSLSETERAMVAMCIQGALRSLEAGTA
ncbi:MBL fold metallo-hydrolase [Candidatus Bipolaricaulota bacterium]